MDAVGPLLSLLVLSGALFLSFSFFSMLGRTQVGGIDSSLGAEPNRAEPPASSVPSFNSPASGGSILHACV